MSEPKKLNDRNSLIQEMLSDGEKIRNFYRFTAQNPHINLHDACQIIINRPNASICYSYEEWNGDDLQRRIIAGRKGIPYYDTDGNRCFVFDVNDTHGKDKYKRSIYPMSRLLKGLRALTGAEFDEVQGDYRKIQVGVVNYLNQNDMFSETDEERNRLLIEGTTYSLYCKTGFPKNTGISLRGMPYSLNENAQLFKEIYETSETLKEEIEEAYLQSLNEVPIIDDTEEETVSDESILPVKEPKYVEIHSAAQSNYKGYLLLVHYTDIEKQPTPEELYLGKPENYEIGKYDNSDNSLIFVSNNPKMFSLMRGDGFTLTQQEMIAQGYFTEQDYKEFYELQNGLLKDFDCERVVKFGMSVNDDESGVPFKYPDWQEEAEKPRYKNPIYNSYATAQEQFPEAVVVLRVGDFYEIMGENAKIISDELDLTLTGRDVGLFERVPMVGFPYHATDRYLEKILENHSVVIIEHGEEPKYIFSHKQVRDEREKPHLIELSDEEAAELGNVFEEEEPTDIYDGEYDEESEDDYSEDETIDDDYADEEQEEKPQPQEKKGKPIKERKRKAKPQMTLFDLIDGKTDEQTPYERRKEEMIKSELRSKGGWQKYRIYEKYQTNSTLNEFAKFVKDTYGTGGYYNGERSSSYDGKGLKLKWEDRENPENTVEAMLKWNEVAVRIADLIDDNEYYTDEEKKEYAEILAKRKARIEAPTDEARLTVIARQFIDEETKRTWNVKADLEPHKFEESSDFIREHREELAAVLRGEKEIRAITVSPLAYLNHIGVEFYPQYCPRVAKEEPPETAEQKKVKEFGERIVKDGTEKTITLSWFTYYDEFGEDEKFAHEHRSEIREYLSTREEVAEADAYDDCISVVFYAKYCKNGEEIISEDKVWHEERELASPDNTDLNEIGFDQSELGGAKTKFRNNLETIRLVERLYIEKREPTNSEKVTLAKYVGWGGLAKAFDEKDENWQKEYKELKEALSTDDYENARASVLSAYYTPKEVIESMYGALEKFGVKGNNRILEPAMGTGNFFGYMPKTIAENAKLYGVELDEITGKIATKLYPNANVQIKGFEQTTFPNNHFDIVVGNVPFGNFGVFDSDYAKENFYIHEYFLAKSVDKLKPNGIMAVITSARTMDKRNQTLRKYVADRAELIGAIRLPNTAFKQIAGTEVVADILFFKKRNEKIYADTENTEWLVAKEAESGYYVNEYFLKHPEMVLGTFKEEVGMYGAKDLTVYPDGRELGQALNDAIANLPANIYINPEYTEIGEQQKIEVDYNVKPMCYKAENGKLYMRVGEEMVEQEIPKHPQDAYERIRGMIELRNQLRHVLDIQVGGCSSDKLLEEQRILNANYDRFVKKYGYVNGSTNKRLFKDDGDSALLFACENYSEENKTATKTDIFSKRTIRPYVAPTSTSDCFEALQISQNERGKVDISYIEELTDKDYDTIISELGETVYRNPINVDPDDKYSGFEMSEEYLSGRVVQKLNAAKRFAMEFPDMGYERNVAALEQVQPTPIPASNISVKVGTNWIDKQYYVQFLFELLGLPRYYYPEGITMFYNRFDSSWRVDVGSHLRGLSSMNVKSVYGTKDASAYRLFEDLLNSRATTIYDTIEENGKEKRVVNQNKTIAAREKQNKIQEAFKAWIFAEPERREDLERTYNTKFNQIRLPKYDGSYLKFPEMNPTIELRPHQKNAVHRIITSGNTLLHHVVGSGKTYTVVSAAMKLRQYGLAKKPMIVVPNHLVDQWGDSFRTLYPKANVLVAHKEDLSKENRQKFVSKVAMGDWDSIIIAQSSFAKIPISQERQVRKINEEIYKIDETIAYLWESSDRPQGAVKNLERIKKNRRKQLNKLLDDSKKDSVLIFENLGVDYLFVDEAHAYKNLFLFTKMNNVSGISTAASQRASDMQLKCEYINELHDADKGVVFATGTPISNSMAEMYTLQTYLQKRTLEETGITFFDGWASNFGETVTALEMAPSGRGYKAKTRFAKFTNLPELLTMYHSFADVQTAEMVKLDTPDVDKKVVTLKPSETVLRLADEIAERAERIHAGGVDIHVDNMLKVTSDGRKVALDPRVFDIACEDEHDSKVNECIERVYEIWEKTTDNKGVQLIFCDQSTPKTAFRDYEYGKDFDVYNDIKFKLVERGIPAEEIAFIHDANTDGQKMALYKDANAGKVRVFIGSTEKCGAGMNVQQRLFALHHLDTPYRPLDLQQREGRIVRQGNGYKNVEIYTYVTERTFDSYSYQILENKQRFISQIESGDMTTREAEDIDEVTLSYAEIKAITAANPRIKRKMEVDTEIQRLRVLESEYRKSLYTTQDNVRKYFPEEIRRQTLYLENLRKDIETVKAKYNPDPEQFSINVLGKEYTDKTEGGRALMEALNSHRPETVVAEYVGFKISLNPLSMLQEERSVSLTGAGQYRMEIGDSEIGLLRRLTNFMTEFPNREVAVVNKLSQLENNLKIAQEQLNVPFEHADELESLLKEQAELNAELDLNKRDEVVIDEQEDGETMSDDDEAYMGVPEKEERQPQRKKPRKPFGKSQKAIYEKVKTKSPDAYVFVNNGGRYEIMGDYTGEIGGTLEKGEYTVTSLNGQELDTAIRKLVDNGQTVKIIDEYEEIKEEESFIDEKDKVAEMEIEVMPDYSIDQEIMENYGYKWKGMLPLRSRAALRLMEMGFEIYKLNADNTEQQINDTQEIRNHSTEIFGIEKPTWKAFYESEKGRVYLSARRAMCESADYVASEELSYVDGRFIEPFIDVNYGEKKGLENYLKDKDDADIDEQKQHVSVLLSEFTSRIYGNDYLYEYGWTKYDVAKSLAENLKDEELSLEVEQKADEWEHRESNDSETMKVADERVVFFGNNGGTAYYYFKDKLSFDNETPRIMEEADEYVIAAPVCYLSQRELEENNITFLKVGRDIDENVLNTVSEIKARREMEKSYNLKLPLEATIINGDCKRDIERYIRNHFNGMHLNVERFEEVINFYGIERVRYVLANTVQLGEADGRYNPFNKEWAKGVIINNDDQHRRLFDVESHPAVIDGLVTFFRRYEKEHPNWTRIDIADGYGNKVTLRPDLALPYFRDSIKGESYGLEVRLYEVVQEDGKDILHPYATLTKSFDEFIGIKNAAYVDTNNCPFASQLLKRGIAKNTGFTKRSGRWEYPLWVFDENFLRQSGEEAYEKYAKQYEVAEVEKQTIYFTKVAEKDKGGKTIFKAYALDTAKGEIYSLFLTEYTTMEALTKDMDRLIYNKPLENFVEKKSEELLAMSNKIIKEKEGQEMPQNEKPKREWETVKVSQNALIKKYKNHSFMRMPTGYYGDCTYNVYNDRITRSTQITDLQSDSRELCFELRFDKNEDVILKDRNNDEIILSVEKFKEFVGGSTNADYVIKTSEGEETKWFTASVPNDALLNMGEKASLFNLPNGSGLGKYAFYIPNAFVKEDTDSEEGRIEISMPSDLSITAKTRDGQEMNITPYQVYTLMDNTRAEQYVRESTKTEFAESKEKAEVKPSENGGWNYVSVHEKAKIAEYGDSTLFRMPTSGDYNGYAYFIPNKLLKANEEKGTIRIALPDGFVVKAQNNRAEKDEEKKVEIQAQDFVAMVKDKGAEDYESYQKPSEEKANDQFSENEARLIENVPQEMKDRPNWVAVKSWWNEEKGKVEKRPINCNTGKYADILDPTTWTSFDKAREFAKENGYTTLAYALDGKDNICCIDLDHCMDENGKYSGLANELMTKCGKTYMEKSMSGKGLHIFGKTNGMDVRTFSKDGDMEFYQQDRFISMTGDGAGYKELENFDKFEVKTLISQKCEKRSDWKGQGQGVEGLSVMDDRDVVEKACADKKYGKTFKALYEGQDLRNNHSNSDMSLMNRLAFWCNGDKEQMLRIFATSGLYRPEKSPSYYEGTAIKAVRDTTGRYNVQQSAPTAPKPINNSGKGGK